MDVYYVRQVSYLYRRYGENTRAAPTPFLNLVLDPQKRTPGLGISFDSSLLSPNDPDINPIDTKYQDATQPEN